MDIYHSTPFDINEIMRSLPHKFRNAKNLKIVIEALTLHKNEIMESIVLMRNSPHLTPDMNSGSLLDQCGLNWNCPRQSGWSDIIYRDKILKNIKSYTSSGTLPEIRDTANYIAGNEDDVVIRERFFLGGGEATASLNIGIYVKRKNLMTSIVETIGVMKPAGVGINSFSFGSPLESPSGNKYSILLRDDYNATVSHKTSRDSDRIVMYSIDDPLNPATSYELKVTDDGRTFLDPAFGEDAYNCDFFLNDTATAIRMYAMSNGKRVAFGNILSSFIDLKSPNGVIWRMYADSTGALSTDNIGLTFIDFPVITDIVDPNRTFWIKLGNDGVLFLEETPTIEPVFNNTMQFAGITATLHHDNGAILLDW